MININELEQQWRAYKKRQMRPYLYGGVVFLFIALIIFFVWPDSKPQVVKKHLAAQTDKKVPKPKPVMTTTLTKQIPVIKNSSSVTTQRDLSVKKPSVQELKPSFDFIRHIDTRATHNVSTHKKTVKRVHQKSAQSKVKQKKVIQIPKETKAQGAFFISTENKEDKILKMINRFNQSKNPLLGIAIAQSFYDKKNYKKAYYYALETNGIDQNNEESWLIASKSLYFLKKRKDAIILLKTYLTRKNSSKGTKLLISMQSGKLVR